MIKQTVLPFKREETKERCIGLQHWPDICAQNAKISGGTLSHGSCFFQFSQPLFDPSEGIGDRILGL